VERLARKSPARPLSEMHKAMNGRSVWMPEENEIKTTSNTEISRIMQFRGSDIAIFCVAVIFLCAILYAGLQVETIQRNILYLVVLSLSCAMVFAFLPFDARYEHGAIFKAGGTAAVFAFCLYMVTNFTEKNYLDNKVRADEQITSLRDSLTAKEKEVGALRSAVSNAQSTSGASKLSMDQINQTLKQMMEVISLMKADINEGVQYSSAARDNSSDSSTCSLRGSQSLAALSRAIPRIASLESNLATLSSLLQK
jgi:hypothetical protein